MTCWLSTSALEAVIFWLTIWSYWHSRRLRGFQARWGMHVFWRNLIESACLPFPCGWGWPSRLRRLAWRRRSQSSPPRWSPLSSSSWSARICPASRRSYRWCPARPAARLPVISCKLSKFNRLSSRFVGWFETIWFVTPWWCFGRPMKIIDRCFANVATCSSRPRDAGRGCLSITAAVICSPAASIFGPSRPP